MPNAFFNPPEVAPPFSPYSHACVIEAPAHWLHVSGQVGVRPDGSTPEDFTAQAELVIGNLTSLLRAAHMGWGDVVKVTAHLTRAADVETWRQVRNHLLGGHAPCSSIVIVTALAEPIWLIQAELVAARSLR